MRSPFGEATFAEVSDSSYLRSAFTAARAFRSARHVIPCAVGCPAVGSSAFVMPRQLSGRLVACRGYGFRGDTREPTLIRLAGGFWPPVTQGGYRNTVHWGTFNLKQHMSPVTFPQSGFVSISRSPSIARAYARQGGARSLLDPRQVAPAGPGWTYAMYIDGYDVGASVVGMSDWNAEVAVPMGVEWSEVVAYRRSDGGGPIFMREGFAARDPFAADQIRYGLSLGMFG